VGWCIAFEASIGIYLDELSYGLHLLLCTGWLRLLLHLLLHWLHLLLHLLLR
jgi:hypothetical protein